VLLALPHLDPSFSAELLPYLMLMTASQLLIFSYEKKRGRELITVKIGAHPPSLFLFGETPPTSGHV